MLGRVECNKARISIRRFALISNIGKSRRIKIARLEVNGGFYDSHRHSPAREH
jgi:hypothetical protein